MKKTIRIITLAVLILTSFLLTSCAALTDSTEIHALSEEMVDALIAKDTDKSYALVSSASTKEEFDDFYEKIESYFDGMGDYTLDLQAKQSGVDDGRSYEIVQYLLSSEKGYYVIQSTIIEGTENLSGFQVGEADKDAVTAIEKTGTVLKLADSNALQIILLVVSLLEILFVLWAVIDCARHKVQSKTLWLVFILIGIFTLAFSFGEGYFHLDFRIAFILQYTALVGHVGGISTLRLMIPAGAIVYTCMRKKLFAQAEAAEAASASKIEPPKAPETPIEESEEKDE